jgi:cellulose biosynthesis protein BcsQ
MKTIACLTHVGGIAKSSLVYHLAWMYAELGLSVVAVDLDLVTQLTRMFVDEDRLEDLWPDRPHTETILGAIRPQLEGNGDVISPHVENITTNLGLVVGDPGLLAWEDELAAQWRGCLDGEPRSFRVISAIWRVIERAAMEREASLVLIDVGPNLGAVNRAALIAAEQIVFPLTPDLYSLEGLRILGPVLRRWRQEWSERRELNSAPDLSVPSSPMTPAGYVFIQHAVRLDRPIQAYNRLLARIPAVYREAVLDEPPGAPVEVKNDPHCLASLKNFRSLMDLAQEARKPMFFLKPSDGALGGHARAVQECYKDFRELARTIAGRCGVPIS